MKLIETTSPLYLRRLVRAINAARAAYVGGHIVQSNHNPRRRARASYCRADKTIRFVGDLYPTTTFKIQAADAEHAFSDHVGHTIYASRHA